MPLGGLRECLRKFRLSSMGMTVTQIYKDGDDDGGGGDGGACACGGGFAQHRRRPTVFAYRVQSHGFAGVAY